MTMTPYKPDETARWSTRELAALVGKNVSVALSTMGEPPTVGPVADAGISRFGQVWIEFTNGRSVEWDRNDVGATVIVEG